MKVKRRNKSRTNRRGREEAGEGKVEKVRVKEKIKGKRNGEEEWRRGMEKRRREWRRGEGNGEEEMGNGEERNERPIQVYPIRLILSLELDLRLIWGGYRYEFFFYVMDTDIG